ncbi:MAG TPA: hypothetical protein VMG10_17545 [Gemmataceae bacterium]|nr:hypothetical protein [Gemmataceae bacterium]
MVRRSIVDANLVARLSLPLAQLYRRAANAKGPLERHLTAFYLWEAALKLLASAALAVYAVRPRQVPILVERLKNLARPSLGHWWEFVQLLVPALAADGDPGFAEVKKLLLGGTRHDLLLVAGLDVALLKALGKQTSPRATMRLAELFERLVSYRNQVSVA